ncbi:hypothetical protein [Thalassotalea sp. PLHSN55]|uniref:hypothetical protein n=1 Tax=Thalassotalea sp. PLHSN55 TaxID=3435888 RepID=UPI003F8783FB
MAVINCPSCKKKISDKAKICSHCQLEMSELSEEKLLTIRKTTIIEKSQKLMNQSFIAMLLFCGGFLFLYWYNAQPGSWQYNGALASTFIGFVLYIITRIRLIFLKKSNK